MRPFPFLPTSVWLVVLRVVLGLYMAAHGATRLAAGTVDDFGGFLAGRGFPFGIALAWVITSFEMVGGATFVAGRFIRPIAAVFAGEHVMGILLVHAPRGWFTVGHQAGGAEYSVLLLLCFLLVASTDTRHPGRRRAGGAIGIAVFALFSFTGVAGAQARPSGLIVPISPISSTLAPRFEASS